MVHEVRALSLFSGIGGLDLAAESCGIETAAFCEIEPFAVQVLERRFPAVENHGDITRFTNRTLRELGGSPFHRFKCPADYNGTIDVVHGGFPCQDLSVAGKQRGLSGERSGLWFEMLRVISELRPAYVLAENVRGACNLALDTVHSGLVGEGYKVYPYVIPASAVGAPHQRERLFVFGVRRDVVHAFAERLQGSERSGTPCEVVAAPSQPIAQCGEGSLWPTPNGNCHTGSGQHGDGGINIQTAVKLWPTPCSRGDDGGGPVGLGGGAMARASIEAALGRDERKNLCSGSLNPLWVECLQGFPLGWTDIYCAEPEPWPGWPALMGESQHPYEPPRTVTGCPNRAKRLKCLGNAVVPQQALPLFEAIAIMEMVSSPVRKREEEDGKNGS